MSDLGYPIITENGVLCYKERHPLLLKYIITFFRCVRKIRRASDNSFDPLVVHIVSFLPRLTLKLHLKCWILGSLSALKMGWYTSRIGIHCCWIRSTASFDFDVWGTLNELLKTSGSHSWATLWDFHRGLRMSNFTENIRFWVPSQHGKWDANATRKCIRCCWCVLYPSLYVYESQEELIVAPNMHS